MRGAAKLEQQRDDSNTGDACYGCARESDVQELNQLAAVAIAEGQPIIAKPQVGAAASISTRAAGKHMTTFKGTNTNFSINEGNDLGRFTSNSSQLIPPKLAPKPKPTQAQTQTQTQTQTTVGRNSLESINSKFSISSANDDFQQPQSQLRPDLQLSPFSSSSAAAAARSPLSLEQSLQIKPQIQQPERWQNSVASSASASSSSSSSSAPAYCDQPSAIVGGARLPGAESTLVVPSSDGSTRRNSQTTKQPSGPLRASHSVAVRYFNPPSVPSSKEDDDCIVNLSEPNQSRAGGQQQEIQMNLETNTTIIQCKGAISPGQQPETSGERQQSPSAQWSAANKSAKQLAPPPPPQQMMALAEKSVKAGEQPPPTPAVMDVSAVNVPTPAEILDTGAPFVFAGIAASIVASVFFSISILCVKLLPDNEGFTDKAKALFFRGLFMMILCGSTIFTTKGTFIVHRDELWVNIARACLGTTGIFGTYCAIKYISIGDSTALVFSSPIWTSILSYFILQEPLKWLQILALPISLFGIVLIAHPTLIVSPDLLSPIINQPDKQAALANLTAMPLVVSSHLSYNNSSSSFDHDQQHAAAAAAAATNNLMLNESSSYDFEHRWPGIVISLMTSLIVSCTYIVLKFRKKTPIQTTTFWLGFTMFVAAFAIMSVIGFGDFPPSSLWEWSLLLGNGFCSWIGQTLLQWALLHEEAGVLSIVRTLDVAMTFVLSALFLDDDIYWTSIVGATIIGLVVASIMLSSWIRNLSLGCMSSHRKQEFSFNDNSSISSSSCNCHPVHKSLDKQPRKTKKNVEKYSQSRGGNNGIIAPQNAPNTISSLASSNKQQQQHDNLDCEPTCVKA